MPAPRGWRTTRRAVVASSLAALLAGCGSGGNPTVPSGPPDQATSTYGYGATKNASVTYQSDVVVVEGGPGVIRSASSDGLVWTVDNSASGASDLQVGKVMFATSRAVGRVVALHNDGSNRVVTLAPVELTDVVRDGDITFDGGLDPGAFVYQDVPALPGDLSAPTQPSPSASPASATESSPARVITLPALLLAARPRDSWSPATLASDLLPQGVSVSHEVTVGDWTMKPSVESGQLGLGISYNLTDRLKAGIDFTFTTSNLRISSAVSVKDGVVTKSGFVIDGIKGLQISLQAGVANSSADNEKVKIEVPIDVSIPIPPQPLTAGLPLNVNVSFNFSVETALTGNNSTLVATGKYKLDGPIGLSGGQFSAPAFSVEQSIIDSISGITLGPSGVVAAVKIKAQLGLGLPLIGGSGPYATLTVSVGVTNGSSLGASLARCHGATLDMLVGGGAELSLPDSVLAALMKLLPPGTPVKNSVENSKTVLHRSQVVPDVPLCNQ